MRIDPEGWVAGGWHRNVHPDDLVDLRKRLAKLAEDGSSPFEAEYRLLTEDYRWVWILQRGRVIERDADGRALQVAGLCIDNDERKREEVGQREQESRLATALWGARAAFWTWHVPTNSGTRSALWYAMTGYTREQWDSVPLPFSSRLHPDDRERTLAAARAHIEGRTESVESEYRIRTAQGSWKWMLGRGRSVEWDLDGKSTLIIGVSLDIDAQKQAEHQLLCGERRLEERCQLAADAARGVIYECDLATQRFQWTGAERFLGYPLAELPASASAWRELIHPDDREQVGNPPTPEQERARRNLGVEYRVRHRAGHYLHVRDHAALVRDANGATQRIFGIAMDITERVALLRDVAGAALLLRSMVERLRAEGSATLSDGEHALARLEAALAAGPNGEATAPFGIPVLNPNTAARSEDLD